HARRGRRGARPRRAAGRVAPRERLVPRRLRRPLRESARRPRPARRRRPAARDSRHRQPARGAGVRPPRDAPLSMARARGAPRAVRRARRRGRGGAAADGEPGRAGARAARRRPRGARVRGPAVALRRAAHDRRARGRLVSKKLVIYLMAEPETPELAHAAVEGGADIVELGFPFSDPLADGPVIRRTRELVGPATPLVPMTYSSILEAYGWERFAADLVDAGGTSVIVADLPAGERPETRRVQLVAPTSTDERIALAGAQTDGWLYLVTLTGTTGARDDVSPALAGLVERARRLVDVPLYASFGISTPAHARAAATLADGIVVGSRAVQVAEEGPDALRDYVATLRDALEPAPANL